jgi:hypothetical protein
MVFSDSNGDLRSSISIQGKDLALNADSMPNIHRIEIMAFDETGKHLETFCFDADHSVTISGSEIHNISADAGSIRIQETNTIHRVSTVSGKICVESCSYIGNVNTMSGDIEVKDCEDVGNINTMSGNIAMKRDASPIRGKK